MKLICNRNNTNPFINLALDEYSLRNLSPTDEYALFYINDPSVIIGKHQNPLEEADINFLRQNNIKLARRISGGGAVYHDHGNLNFGFITKFAQNRVHNFRYFTKPVIRALKKFGVHAALNKRNDIIVNGYKVSGNAQFSNTKMILSHGTLLFDSNLSFLSQSLKSDAKIIESRSIKSVRSKVTNIKNYTNDEIELTDLQNEIINSLNENFSIQKFELDDKQWDSIYELAEKKYKSNEWIFCRTPEFKIKKVMVYDKKNYDTVLTIKDGIISNVIVESHTSEQILNEIQRFYSNKSFPFNKI